MSDKNNSIIIPEGKTFSINGQELFWLKKGESVIINFKPCGHVTFSQPYTKNTEINIGTK